MWHPDIPCSDRDRLPGVCVLGAQRARVPCDRPIEVDRARTSIEGTESTCSRCPSPTLLRTSTLTAGTQCRGGHSPASSNRPACSRRGANSDSGAHTGEGRPSGDDRDSLNRAAHRSGDGRKRLPRQRSARSILCRSSNRLCLPRLRDDGQWKGRCGSHGDWCQRNGLREH